MRATAISIGLNRIIEQVRFLIIEHLRRAKVFLRDSIQFDDGLITPSHMVTSVNSAPVVLFKTCYHTISHAYYSILERADY
jgi:hypothetical protein